MHVCIHRELQTASSGTLALTPATSHLAAVVGGRREGEGRWTEEVSNHRGRKENCYHLITVGGCEGVRVGV